MPSHTFFGDQIRGVPMRNILIIFVPITLISVISVIARAHFIEDYIQPYQIEQDNEFTHNP